MPVLSRPAAPTHELPGACFTSLATPTTGSVDTSVWEVRLSPDHPAATHQLTRQEVFVILEGHGHATLAGVDHPLEAGSVLIVPAHTPFGIASSGEADLVALCCFPADGQAIMGNADPFTPPWAV
jgi:mannose-6-phosphate isomerase-like protein (cupin superfamily)